MRDPEPGFAPRWIRTPMRSPRCLLGALVALLLLSFVICGELTPLGVLFRGCWGLGTPPVGLRVPLPQCLGCWWRGTRGLWGAGTRRRDKALPPWAAPTWGRGRACAPPEVTPLKNCIKYCLNPATTHPVALWRGCSRGCLSVCLSADGGGCKLCPVGWTLHRSKCFLVASKSSSWRESREKCSHQRAQLLVPEDQGELVTGLILARMWDGAQGCTRGAVGCRNLGSAPIGCRDGCPNLWGSIRDIQRGSWLGGGGGASFGDSKQHHSHQPRFPS